MPNDPYYSNGSTLGLSESSESSDLQMRWDRAMCQVLGLPEGYLSVSVLLIQWWDNHNQPKAKNEVQQLDRIFRDTFGFTTHIFDLSEECSCDHVACSCTPQDRLQQRILQFMGQCDSPHNLSVIYYTGYGSLRMLPERDLLLLHG
jgi:hypothetical protein